MSHRTFKDRRGRRWEVRVRSKREWAFEPVSGNPGPPRRGAPPLYAGDDPFELSEEELRRILGDARAEPGRSASDAAGGKAKKASPFGDAYEPPASRSPFEDLRDDDPPEKRSPFLDDR